MDRVNVAEATVEIKNRLGLHLRAASTLAQTVNRFRSSVYILGSDNTKTNARSITGLMMLGAGQGTKLRVTAEGPDAAEALAAVEALFEARFGEE